MHGRPMILDLFSTPGRGGPREFRHARKGSSSVRHSKILILEACLSLSTFVHSVLISARQRRPPFPPGTKPRKESVPTMALCRPGVRFCVCTDLRAGAPEGFIAPSLGLEGRGECPRQLLGRRVACPFLYECMIQRPP